MQNTEKNDLATWIHANPSDWEKMQNVQEISFSEIFLLWRRLREDGFVQLADSFIMRHAEYIMSIIPKTREEFSNLLYDTLRSGGIESISREDLSDVVEAWMDKKI